MLTELVSLGVTAKALRANIGSKSAISLQQKTHNFRYNRLLPNNHSSSKKTRLKDLLYGIKSGQIFLPFCYNARA